MFEHDCGADIDHPEGSMQQIEAGGEKLLLTRVSGIYHAVSGICPHAGASLAEGTLHGETVVCPWHKAAFSVVSGRLLEPPAVDCLRTFPARVENGRILVTIGDATGFADLITPPKTSDTRCFAIVGAGAAGALAAQTLREEGFAGRVVLIGREAQLPYDRTLLSKYALSGQEGGEKTPLQDDRFYRANRIEYMTADVRSIDPAARRITFADGAGMAYDSALVATGGTPRRPSMPGADLRGVFVLRSASDADAIVAAAASARSAIVAGTGFIAMEAAASLRERGLDVTVVAPQAVPFERQLGHEIGHVFRRLHEQNGVVFRLGEEIEAIEGIAQVQTVRLTGGERLPADLVIAGFGVTPDTGLLMGVKLREDRGVDVAPDLRLTDHLYAAGDIAAFPLGGDGQRIRVEHWRVAQQHGRLAALNMMGDSRPFDTVPYFWTIHFMKRLDYVGHAETWDSVIIDGDLQKPQFLAFYIRSDKVAAIAGWDCDRQMAASIHLMTQRRDWTVDELRQALAPWV